MSSDPNWLVLSLAVALVLLLVGAVLWLSRAEAEAVDGRFPADGSGDDSADSDAAGGTSRRGRRGRARPPRAAFGDATAETPDRTVAVVVNPTKFPDVDKTRAEVQGVVDEHRWNLLWLETTEEDPGKGQTEQALAQGVELVCPLGGDGTVRTVGAVLTGSSTPLGLLPGGTGNLLARNLKLPVDSLTAALTVALTGRNERIDTCTLTLTRPPTVPPDPPPPGTDADDPENQDYRPLETEELVFLVMAGLGFDADVMANAPEGLKNKVGWAAYLVSGVTQLRGASFQARVRFDHSKRLRRRVRSIVVGNVGKLQGGMVLLPEARHDDGVIDAVLLSPRGLAGWGAVVLRLASKKRKGHQRVDFHSAREIEIQVDRPVEIELDGDAMGPVVAMSVAVNPASLVVRMPH